MTSPIRRPGERDLGVMTPELRGTRANPWIEGMRSISTPGLRGRNALLIGVARRRPPPPPCSSSGPGWWTRYGDISTFLPRYRPLLNPGGSRFGNCYDPMGGFG